MELKVLDDNNLLVDVINNLLRDITIVGKEFFWYDDVWKTRLMIGVLHSNISLVTPAQFCCNISQPRNMHNELAHVSVIKQYEYLRATLPKQ